MRRASHADKAKKMMFSAKIFQQCTRNVTAGVPACYAQRQNQRCTVRGRTRGARRGACNRKCENVRNYARITLPVSGRRHVAVDALQRHHCRVASHACAVPPVDIFLLLPLRAVSITPLMLMLYVARLFPRYRLIPLARRRCFRRLMVLFMFVSAMSITCSLAHCYIFFFFFRCHAMLICY